MHALTACYTYEYEYNRHENNNFFSLPLHSHLRPLELIMTQSASVRLALPSVVVLILFLAYGSQILFRYIEPYALEQKQALIFNALVCCIWITYIRTCFTNPGWVPNSWSLDRPPSEQSVPLKRTARWCRKCEAFKPPRSHHCKNCRR